jgi:hypothetical protein
MSIAQIFWNSRGSKGENGTQAVDYCENVYRRQEFNRLPKENP